MNKRKMVETDFLSREEAQAVLRTSERAEADAEVARLSEQLRAAVERANVEQEWEQAARCTLQATHAGVVVDFASGECENAWLVKMDAPGLPLMRFNAEGERVEDAVYPWVLLTTQEWRNEDETHVWASDAAGVQGEHLATLHGHRTESMRRAGINLRR